MSAFTDLSGRDSQRAWINEDNLWEFSSILARGGGGEAHEETDVRWTRTDGLLFNRVFAAQFDAGKTVERIGELVGEFLSRGLNMTWIVGPSTRPIDLAKSLSACGFAHSIDWHGMDIDLNSMPPGGPEPEGCRVEEVADESALAAWFQVVRDGFGFEQDTGDAMYAHCAGAGFGRESPMHHYLAYHNNVPSSACTAYWGSKAVGIYFVTTIPSARRRGLAEAVSRRALEESRQSGRDTAILQCSRAARGLYRKLGFHPCCTLELYSLNTPPR